ncbi:MAG: hypothetical protein ACR2PA_25630 [Hyphomicrobiaceae bacterium]
MSTMLVISLSLMLAVAVLLFTIAAHQKNALLHWAAGNGSDTVASRADAAQLQQSLNRFGRWHALQHLATLIAVISVGAIASGI